MPKKEETTSQDLKYAFQSIIEILSHIEWEECSTLLEDCLRDRARMKDLDCDLSESEEEDEDLQSSTSDDENEDDF